MIAREDQYVAFPCSGDNRLGNPVVERGHVYRVESPNGADEGFMTLSKAQEKFGIEAVFISPSDTICSDCTKAKGFK
ncbi:MAG: hypothetical protein NT076_01730 [Candidatus Pacearchaeota archaeon]|nr:hypothetical protein [Candidatus Pacearchaeota archaeon]